MKMNVSQKHNNFYSITQNDKKNREIRSSKRREHKFNKLIKV